MKVLLVVNLAWNAANFRAGLIRALIEDGHEVVVAAPWDEHADRVVALGSRFVPVAMDNGGTIVRRDAGLFMRLVRLLRRERPDVLLAYTAKPNIYGSIAARLLGVPVVNNIAGLGATFIRPSLLTRVMRLLYRVSLSRSRVVFFQNRDDRDQFVRERLANPDRSRLIPGSGIDLRHYAPVPLPAAHGPDDACHFLLVARMLFDKGVAEYVEAARRVRALRPRTRFSLLGFLDVANPAAVSREQMDAWVASGAVEYLGSSTDVRCQIATADCVVLPSYREGVPRTLLEAAAMGRPIVTTDAVGCREVVDDGHNGYLCRVRDAADLADKLLRIVDAGAAARQAMGAAGRRKVEQTFDERRVIDLYREAIAEATA